jgi:hypothetical protein
MLRTSSSSPISNSSLTLLISAKPLSLVIKASSTREDPSTLSTFYANLVVTSEVVSYSLRSTKPARTSHL